MHLLPGYMNVHLFIVLVLLLPGCANIYKPQNTQIEKLDLSVGYRIDNPLRKPPGDHLLTLAFSGGGTRAAAFSYGVMQELRDTKVSSNGSSQSLLEEIDTISAVSGGSFTAAYYGLFGNELFDTYEDDFLRQSIQGTLIRKLFNPLYLGRSLFSGFDRTEMAVEYYDQNIFRGKTFADIPLDQRPYIVINATDLSSGNRFTFTQSTFDMICSDIRKFPVARAVTASSAVPVAFPPVVLENHSDKCDVHNSPFVKRLLKKKRLNRGESDIAARYKAFQNLAENSYLHLVDGGLSDNLALRVLFDQIDGTGGIEKAIRLIKTPPRTMLVILVNAAVAPEKPFGHSAEKPSLRETVSALSATQIALYNAETISMVKSRMVESEKLMAGTDTPIHFYFVDLNFQTFTEPSAREFFNRLPTSLELDDKQVDSLIKAGRHLLRSHPEYQRFLKENGAEPEILGYRKD